MIEFNPLKSPCVECGLWVGKKHPCIRPQEKNLKTGGIVLIGEAPGSEEDACGSAFVGPAGKIIREALGRLGVTTFTFLNAVCCRPTKGVANRPPTARESGACNSFLCDNLTRLEPSVVICLGLVAAKSLGLTGKMRDLRNREWSINRHTWLQNAPQELVREMQRDGERALGKESSPWDASSSRDPRGGAGTTPEVARQMCMDGAGLTVPCFVTYHPAASMRPGQKHLAQVMEEDIRLYLTKGSLRDPLIYTEPEPTRRPHLSSEYHIFEEKSMSDNQAPKWVTVGKMVNFSWGPNNMRGIYEGAPTVRKPDTDTLTLGLDKQEEVCDNTIRECRLVVDIETDGFLKDKDPFHFGDPSREVWVVGTDQGRVQGSVDESKDH